MGESPHLHPMDDKKKHMDLEVPRYFSDQPLMLGKFNGL